MTESRDTHTFHNVKPFTAEICLRLADVVEERGVLFSARDAAGGEGAVLEALESLPDGGLLVVDFSSVRVSSEAARRLIRRAVQRVAGGELGGRFIVLAELGGSWYNVDVMLQGEDLVIVERLSNGDARVIGRVEPAMRDTYEYLLTRTFAAAGDVKRHFRLENTSTATNRLTKLWKQALARRVEEMTVPGGGKQLVYTAVR